MNTIPTPTIRTTIIDAQEVTSTVWAVGDHALTRIQRENAPHSNWRTDRLVNNIPHVDEDASSWLDDTARATYTVNWSAQGDQTPEEALEYGASIMAAANAANVFASIRAENK